MEIQTQNQPNHPLLTPKVLWTVIGFLLLVVVVGSYFWWQEIKRGTGYSLQGTVENQTVHWKTYKNSEYGLEFKYPPDTIVEKKENIYGTNLVINFPSGGSFVYIDGPTYDVSGTKTTIKIDGKDYEMWSQDYETGKDYRVFLGNKKEISFNNKNYIKEDEVLFYQILSTFKFADVVETYTNNNYGFEFSYPIEEMTIEEGYVSSGDPNSTLAVVNIFGLPKGQDRDAVVFVIEKPLDNFIETYYKNATKTNLEINGINWTKFTSTEAVYLTEYNNRIYYFSGPVEFQEILSTFKFIE